MRIPASGRYQALLIPDEAVNTDQNERYLLIVGTNDVVQRRTVKLGALFGTLRSITDGLKPGEWVIVNGMQSAMPGAKVRPARGADLRRIIAARWRASTTGAAGHANDCLTCGLPQQSDSQPSAEAATVKHRPFLY